MAASKGWGFKTAQITLTGATLNLLDYKKAEEGLYVWIPVWTSTPNENPAKLNSNF